ncbi:MAG: hypothetical protein L0H53_09800 [Candidatus Nitrosocosmicus sp.]|nr:hypothetical protein [Candidatus Nitrosocosmicus sp.]MDN5867954.1 hypothetical protein [Candidatus Nitrosocosmicus sp.]
MKNASGTSVGPESLDGISGIKSIINRLVHSNKGDFITNLFESNSIAGGTEAPEGDYSISNNLEKEKSFQI